MRFAVVAHKDTEDSYGVMVPDLPGCISAADTLDDAFESVREAILVHIEGMLAAGEEAPRRKSIQEHLGGEFSEDYEDGIWGLVDVDLDDIPADPMVRVNITVPSRLLARIDRRARQEGTTRSAFLAEAATDHVSTKPYWIGGATAVWYKLLSSSTAPSYGVFLIAGLPLNESVHYRVDVPPGHPQRTNARFDRHLLQQLRSEVADLMTADRPDPAWSRWQQELKEKARDEDLIALLAKIDQNLERF